MLSVWHVSRLALPLSVAFFLLYSFCDVPGRKFRKNSTDSAMEWLEPLLRIRVADLGPKDSLNFQSNAPGSLLRKLVNATINLCEDYLKNHDHDNFTDPYPYYAFLPVPLTESGYLQSGESVTAQSDDKRCWDVKMTAEYVPGLFPGLFDHIDITANVTEGKIKCDRRLRGKASDDLYVMATIDDITFIKVEKPGILKKRALVGHHKAQIWNAKTFGVRLFSIAGGQDKAIWSVMETLRLFEPLMSNPTVPEKSAERNRDFLKKYANLNITKRTGEIHVNISEDIIKEGDFMALQRLDGLDPMLSWAMGSSTGHTAIAMRFDGVLHIVESTGQTEYWPVNGMQKTEWNEWLRRYRAANYAVVHLPLSEESRAKYNSTAAQEAFVTQYEGFDYGYANMLFSWIDSVEGNFPCLPAEGEAQGCLKWQVWEVLNAMLEKFDSSVAEQMFLPAQRKRVGLDEGTFAEILQAAYTKFNGKVSDLVKAPEQDAWLYNTTLNGKPHVGPSRMCDALVCSLWKAGGLFGDLKEDIQCTEFTNWDAWGLQIFDADWPSKRPDICKQNDPENEFCQLSGEYTLHLRTPMYWWNERPLVAHMAENCPSLPPKYERPPNC